MKQISLKDLEKLAVKMIMVPDTGVKFVDAEAEASGLSITKDRDNGRTPWMKFEPWSFSSEEDWKALCNLVGCDPEETNSIKLYVDHADID